MIADTPLADLRPAPWNPRTIKDERFKNLVRSVQADPDFLYRRPILATADGTIYAGNMRYRAAEHLKLPTVPAVFDDIPEQLAKERALRDNQQWGDWHEDELAEMLYTLNEQGSAIDLLGFDPEEVDRLLATVAAAGFPELPDGDRSPFRQMTFTVTAEQQEAIDEALRQAKALGEFVATGNENSNGNALARVCEVFLGVG